MPTSTTNYGLIKPGTDDPILIGQLNDNMDTIDAALKENANAIENKPDAADIPTPSTAAPAMDGTAAAGTSTDYARADHVHPSDTSKQNALSSTQLDAVNSGIDSTKVEQIETNEKNILFNQNMGVKNILKNTATSSGIFTVNADGTIKAQGSSGGSTAFVIVSTISASDAYKLNGMILNGCPSGGESGGYRINLQLFGGDYTNYAIDKGDGAVISGIPQNPSYNLRLVTAVEAGKTVDIVFKPMISTIGGEYQPYAPSNRELYEMILALQ